jgi:hypothetical protein
MVTAVLALGALLGAACGGGAAVGEECGEAGVTDGECEDGAVCGKHSDADAELTCLTICTDSSQCAQNEDCNGVAGTNIKACRLRNP